MLRSKKFDDCLQVIVGIQQPLLLRVPLLRGFASSRTRVACFAALDGDGLAAAQSLHDVLVLIHFAVCSSLGVDLLAFFVDRLVLHLFRVVVHLDAL